MHYTKQTARIKTTKIKISMRIRDLFASNEERAYSKEARKGGRELKRKVKTIKKNMDKVELSYWEVVESQRLLRKAEIQLGGNARERMNQEIREKLSIDDYSIIWVELKL
jgi:hypothetical protein